MSDTERLIDSLGLVGEPNTDEAAPDAADISATPTEPSDDAEAMTLDEALAGLDGEAAPDQTAPATAPPTDSADEAATPEVADLLRQLDAYKAREAEAQAAQADANFLAPWQRQQAVNDDFFEAEEARIKRLGAEQGRTEAEIKAAIYDRVELGIDFGIQRINPQTRQPELIGRIQADAELSENLRRAEVDYERSKTRPNAFEALVSAYALDATDRTALAKFINYPPEHLEEIAKTLAGKNQRLQSTQQHVRNDAVANVRARLSGQTAPGIPGAAPSKKPYVFTHAPAARHDETRLVAGGLGLTRPQR